MITAPREKNFDFTGVGCLIQILGLLAPFVLSAFLSYIGGAIGIVLLFVLFFAGLDKSTKWICGNCKNPIDSEEVAVCTACDARLV